MSFIEQKKEITLDGKTFIVEKFNPEDGCLWAFRFLGNTASVDIGDFMGKIQNFVNITTEDKKSFERFRLTCLSYVSVKLPEGSFPLLNEVGGFTTPGITTPIAFQLMLESFMFTISDFFDKALISGLWTTVLSPFQKIGQSNSSSSQSKSDTGTTTTSGTGNIQSQTSST